MDAGAVGEAVGEAQVDEGEGVPQGDMGAMRLGEPNFRSDPCTTGAVGSAYWWVPVPAHEVGIIIVASCPCLPTKP